MGQQTTLSSSSEGGEEAEPSAGPVVLRWNAQNHNNNHAHKVRNAPERVRMGFRAMVAPVYRVLPGFFECCWLWSDLTVFLPSSNLFLIKEIYNP